MIDIITHTTNTAALVAELQTKLPSYITIDPAGNPIFLVDKTITIRNGTETLSLIRLTNEKYAELLAAELTTLELLGTYDEVFADPVKKAIYDRVYPRTFLATDPEGKEITVTRSEKFCVFA